MSKITAILVDDEPQALSALKQEIELHCPQLKVLGTASDIESCIQLIETTRPDVAFMDIQLEEGLSFEIIDKTQHIPYQIIFTTAYNQYAIRAIKLAAIDYLLKPINRKELISSVQKITKQNPTRDTSLLEQIALLKNELEGKTNNSSKIALNSKSGVELIETSDILYFAASSNYSEVYIQNRPRILASRTLKDISQIVDSANFCRIHHSYLINLQHLVRFNSKENLVELTNGTIIPISLRKKAQFIEQANLKNVI